MSVFLHVCKYTPCMQYPGWSEERAFDPPGTEVTDGGDPPHRCWELHVDALREQIYSYLLSHPQAPFLLVFKYLHKLIIPAPVK